MVLYSRVPKALTLNSKPSTVSPYRTRKGTHRGAPKGHFKGILEGTLKGAPKGTLEGTLKGALTERLKEPEDLKLQPARSQVRASGAMATRSAGSRPLGSSPVPL